MIWLLACAGGDADRFRAYTLGADPSQHVVQPRTIDTLQDPSRLSGSLGTGYAGGVMSVDLESITLSYEPGKALDVQYQVVEGVATPLDRDGLILFSFYGHLQDARDTLGEAGVDITPLFPIDFGVTPAMPDIGFAFAPVDNAAYAPGANAFILLDDLGDREVPLAANAGVVTHELGHGIFHLWTAGGPYADRGFAVDSLAGPGVGSLDEGHADMMASRSCPRTTTPTASRCSTATTRTRWGPSSRRWSGMSSRRRGTETRRWSSWRARPSAGPSARSPRRTD